MKPIVAVLALVSLAGLVICFPRILTARAASSAVMQPASVTSCVDRYNSLVRGAKSALTRGDRASAIDLLEQAKTVVSGCPVLQDASSRLATLSL
jgi:hypothetical protein